MWGSGSGGVGGGGGREESGRGEGVKCAHHPWAHIIHGHVSSVGVYHPLAHISCGWGVIVVCGCALFVGMYDS